MQANGEPQTKRPVQFKKMKKRRDLDALIGKFKLELAVKGLFQMCTFIGNDLHLPVNSSVTNILNLLHSNGNITLAKKARIRIFL